MSASPDVVVIGASAGGVAALLQIAPSFPAGFPAVVLVVLHLDPRRESLLPGTGSDGAMGVRAVKAAGGVVIVEDPATADSAGMPSAAVRTGCVDLVTPVIDIGAAIVEAMMLLTRRTA